MTGELEAFVSNTISQIKSAALANRGPKPTSLNVMEASHRRVNGLDLIKVDFDLMVGTTQANDQAQGGGLKLLAWVVSIGGEVKASQKTATETVSRLQFSITIEL
jgi:hypothetical protein